MMRQKVVDHLFARLALQYGARWLRLWEGPPIDEVKASWARELAPYDTERGHQVIAWALENLPEGPPNAIEFRNLCRRAPLPPAKPLPAPPADPARMAAELERLQAVRQQATVDRLAWARAIEARAAAGERVRPAALRMALEALGRNRSD